MIRAQTFFQQNQPAGPFAGPLMRPSAARPVIPANSHNRVPSLAGRRLAQGSAVSQKALFYGAGLINLALMGATAWVGITVGREKKGVLGIAGWVTGIGAILAGLYSLGVMGVETVKPSTETALVPAAAPQG